MVLANGLSDSDDDDDGGGGGLMLPDATGRLTTQRSWQRVMKVGDWAVGVVNISPN